MGNARILVVEDEALAGAYTKLILEEAGYEVIGIEISGEEAVIKTAQNHPDLALIDISLEGEMSGIEVAKIIRELYDIPSLFVTAYSPEEVMDKSPGLKSSDIITKPIRAEQLRDKIANILKQEHE
jgi:CheY-like chemotaxis protein